MKLNIRLGSIIGSPIILILVILLVLQVFHKYDDTDDESTKTRSGMSLYIDRGTGCHYLGNIFGVTTPRLDNNGKQICCDTDRRKQ